MIARLLRVTLLALSLLAIAGCDLVLLNPAGDIARQQSDLMMTSVWLMLLIVVPVIIASLWFAWYYRESNEKATYTPDWDHSTLLELYIWAAPLLIIIALGAVTWITTHTLDPYRPLERIAEDRPLPENAKHMKVQAVALEWKWLFFYPELGIATVNELAAPVDVPVEFNTTSHALMNSLFIPTLAGMIYAMPGMQTQFHAVINEPGDYYGVSGNYSGAGYSDMKFRFYGMSKADFAKWVEEAKASGRVLDTATYQELTKHSIKHPVEKFATVENGLYRKILNMCVEPGQLCMDEMMSHHAAHAGKPAEADH